MLTPVEFCRRTGLGAGIAELIEVGLYHDAVRRISMTLMLSRYDRDRMIAYVREVERRSRVAA